MIKKENEIKIDYFTIEGTPGGNQACWPYDPETLTKKEYVDFSMVMKPYIHPRMGGVAKVSLFTEGFGRYLNDRGFDVQFAVCPGESSFEEAEAFIRDALKKNLPVPFLLLRHRDKSFKDLNWHWFMITGYDVRNERSFLKYHTYGEEQEIDFERLWSTGMYRRGGMAAIQSIRQRA